MDPLGNLLGEWSLSLNIWSILFRLFLALLFSSCLGWERSIKRHSAGLRTFILITLASTVIMMIETALPNDSTYFLSAAAVVSISYLSAHSLFTSSRNQIKGLTTSVGLWASGINGLAIGAGYYTIALFTFFAMMISLSLFPSIEKNLKDRSNHFEIHLELSDSKSLRNFVTTIRELGMEIDDIEFNPAYLQSGLSVYSISISINNELLEQYKTHKDIIEALSTLDYVNHIEEIQ